MMDLMSDEINEIALALCKAQSEMGPAVKDKKNPFFKSNYADLSSCIAALRDPFGNNDLCFFQSTMPAEAGNVRIITTIAHKSGQWIRGVIDIKPSKNDPQGAGSAISYGKRYGLQALSGLPTEDDDGESAMNRNKRNKPMPKMDHHWTPGNMDKYGILCDEQDMNQEDKCSLVTFYLRQSKCKFMTQQGSDYLVNNFGAIYQDWKNKGSANG